MVSLLETLVGNHPAVQPIPLFLDLYDDKARTPQLTLMAHFIIRYEY